MSDRDVSFFSLLEGTQRIRNKKNNKERGRHTDATVSGGDIAHPGGSNMKEKKRKDIAVRIAMMKAKWPLECMQGRVAKNVIAELLLHMSMAPSVLWEHAQHRGICGGKIEHIHGLR